MAERSSLPLKQYARYDAADDDEGSDDARRAVQTNILDHGREPVHGTLISTRVPGSSLNRKDLPERTNKAPGLSDKGDEYTD